MDFFTDFSDSFVGVGLTAACAVAAIYFVFGKNQKVSKCQSPCCQQTYRTDEANAVSVKKTQGRESSSDVLVPETCPIAAEVESRAGATAKTPQASNETRTITARSGSFAEEAEPVVQSKSDIDLTISFTDDESTKSKDESTVAVGETRSRSPSPGRRARFADEPVTKVIVVESYPDSDGDDDEEGEDDDDDEEDSDDEAGGGFSFEFSLQGANEDEEEEEC